jgi:hypothetical protein
VSGLSFSDKFPALGAAFVALGAIAAAPTENSTDRPSGVYAYVPANDAAGCAIACAQDTICLAWSFKATEFVGCALKAVVPTDAADATGQSGIAARASQFISLTTLRKPDAAPQSMPAPPPQPAQTAEAPIEITTFHVATLAHAAHVVAPSLSLTDAPRLELSIVSEPTTQMAAIALPRATAPAPLQITAIAPAPAQLAAPTETFVPPAADTFLKVALAPNPPTLRVTTLPPTLGYLNLATAAPIAEEQFAAPAPITRVAPLSTPPSVRATAPPMIATLRMAVAAPLEEERFIAPEPMGHLALLTPTPRPRIVTPPALANASLQLAIVREETPHLALTSAAPGATLAQMALAVQPVMIVASASTPPPRRSQSPVAAPAPNPALTPDAAEEDLLGGPDPQ